LPRGEAKHDITFEIDENGILTVSAVVETTGKKEKIVITNDMGRLSKDEIERMISEAERYKVEDEANKNRAEAKVLLKNYCYKLQSMLKSTEVKNNIPANEITYLRSAISTTLMFIETNPTVEVQKYKDKQIELEKRAQRIYCNHGAPSRKENVKNAGDILLGAFGKELLKIAADLAMRAVLDATLTNRRSCSK
jgi:molecular chaperone DnaK (HSP70)